MHNWDDFRYFYAVANHGSFSVAARQLGVNHSTVSRRIQLLEEQHGVRLFERSRSGYSLTEAGASIYDIIKQVNDNSLMASRVLLGQDARLEGKIKLTMPHDLFESCLVAPLQRFCRQNPAIEMNLQLSPDLRDLASREADVAVRLTPSPPDYLVGKCIARLQHGIYRACDLQPQKETPIVVWGGDKDMPGWANEHFDKPRVALRVDDLASMHAAVKAGFGVARMPCFFPDALQRSFLQDPALQRLPITLPRSDWGIWLLSHVDLRNTARINHCKAFLTEALTEMVPLFEGRRSVY